MVKKVLILGSKGMLGQELVRVFSMGGQYAVTAWDREEIDVTDKEKLEARSKELGPDIILNAVAYNAVDPCETDEAEYDRAMLLNSTVPGFLAEASQKVGATLVHYSTDYVFDGSLETGYDEEALAKPISRYGETKRAGERQVLESSARAYLIRLSKLFGQPALSGLGKQSFFEMMLAKGKEASEVKVVNGERSCFTYAPDLAQATRALIESQALPGIYHLPNEGAVTWYEAARELYRLAGLTTRIVPVTSDAFPRPARRPASSVLLNTKRPKLRDYREALVEYLKRES